MILLDTNVLSELMNPSPSVTMKSWLDGVRSGDLRICAITRGEIELGIALMPRGRRREHFTASARKLYAYFRFRCLPFEENAAIIFGRVVAERRKLGRPISILDAQIASIALVHGLKLATRNIKDFQHIEGLNLINPWHFHE
jgi:predicted nucleic acid-binding protein